MAEIDDKYVADLLGITPEELDAEIQSFEDGAWDSSGFGEPKPGRALLFGEPAKPVTFKEAPSVIARMDARAAARGESSSEYLRALVAADLAAAGANRPYDITSGGGGLIFANADPIFDAAAVAG